MRDRSLAELLGYPADARLLIVNADDFGMCHAGNAATIEGLAAAVYSSSTVMVPCPWFPDAVSFARESQAADIGVHVTHTSEWAAFKWRPLCGRESVPSLVDAHGYFPPTVEQFYGRATLAEVERETRAQIELALAVGIDVTHLDSHMGTLQLRADYYELYVRLAADYRLPFRCSERSWMARNGLHGIRQLADRLGVLAPDSFHYGGPPAPADTPAYWSRVFRELRAGVTELYVHPARPDPELSAICPKWAQRVADHRFFMAVECETLLRKEGVITIGYRLIRDLQRALNQ